MYGLFQHEDWLQDWNGLPFNNTFFLRNPQFPPEGVYEFDGDGKDRREVGITSAAKPRLDAMRAGAVEGELSKRHFADPALAWDSAVAFNDGGVTYLVENLERVLSPKLKTTQLVGRLVDQAKLLDGRLRRFYQADDEASRKEKEDALMALRRRLYKASNERAFRNFIRLLACMKVNEAEVRAAFLNVGSLKFEAAAAPPDEGQPDDENDPWATEAEEPGGKAAAAAPARQRDRYDLFATQVMNLWTERVRGVSTDAPVLAALGMDAQSLSDVGNELVIAAHRTGLANEIADKVRTQVAAANLRWDEVADRCAGIATMLVNDYVAYLGYGTLAADKRPGFPEPPQPRTRAVFSAPALPPAGSIPLLGKQRAALEQQYFIDWGVSLKQLGLDNVSFAGGREIDDKENLALGRILTEIAPAHQIRPA
jgi:hypothetical protein